MKNRFALLVLFSVSAAAALPGTDTDVAGTPLPEAPAPLPVVQPLPALQPQPAPEPAVVTEVDRQLDELDKQERSLKTELDELGRNAETARVRTIARGRAYVRLARAGLLPVGAGFDALVDHAAKVERLRRALGRDVTLERTLADRRVAIGKKLDLIRQRRGPLEVQQKALAQARDALLSAQDRALAFQRAFESNGVSAPTAVYGAGVGPLDPSDVAHGFASMKGRLPFPIPGRAELRSARRPGADGPGLEMRAPRGTPVRAVYTGKVSFADEYSVYGKTVILEHGDGYYTVSANLADFAVHVGDEVSSGARIGSVGDMGPGPVLYFEIRHGTQTVDPAEWFGI